MDIGIIHPELIYPQGAEKQVCKLSYNLIKRGHNVTIYTFEKQENYIFDPLLKDVEVISLKESWDKIPFGNITPYAISTFNHSLKWMYLLKKLSFNFKLKKHDVLNAHNHPSQWISTYTEIPTVWMCNEPVGWHYYSWPKSKLCMVYIPYIIDKRLSSNVKLIATLDSKMQTIIRKAYPDNNSEIVYSGAELDRIIKHVENDFFDIIFVGPLQARKRPMDILCAGIIVKHKIKNLRLHFIGRDLGLGKELEFISKKYGIPIKIYNSVSDEKLYELYGIADLAVYVPELQPWGIFPLEAILAGIPTIISDQCGVTDILPKDKIPVIETGNIQQLANQILEIAKSYSEAKENTRKVSEILKEKYSWEKYTERMLKVFESII